MSGYDFIVESNKIEGILRPPTDEEVKEYLRFMELPRVTIPDLEQFVGVYQPGAVLRCFPGMDVRVGNYYPPRGGPDVVDSLEVLLLDSWKGIPFSIHREYERLHPFTDCNGRSGRMLWMWGMKKAPLGFLHTFYYQTLRYGYETRI